MATRTEDRFGQLTNLGATYTLLCTVGSGHTYNFLFNVANRTGTSISLRLYIADTSWTSGEPTGGTLKVAIAYDMPVAKVEQITGIIGKSTEKIIAYASSTGLDIMANGVDIV